MKSQKRLRILVKELVLLKCAIKMNYDLLFLTPPGNLILHNGFLTCSWTCWKRKSAKVRSRVCTLELSHTKLRGSNLLAFCNVLHV